MTQAYPAHWTSTDFVTIPAAEPRERKVDRALLTTQEAAQYLQIEESTLTNWRCTKRYGVPFIRVGRLIRYRLSDLEAFLESRTVRPVDWPRARAKR